MSLSIGIVGLPNVGKSTLFQALTKKQVDCSNYPFCTIDPNVGVVAVLDERVDRLADLCESAKKIYTAVEFVDIAGLVKGAHKGEGLGNQFLSRIKEVDAIVYILRAFSNAKIINTQTKIDPAADKEILDTELMLKDMETIEKRTSGLEKEARARDKEAIKEMEVIKKAKSFLEKGVILAEADFDDNEKKILKSCQLLTLKPRIYFLNGSFEEISEQTFDFFKKNNWVFLAANILEEFESAGLSPEERVALGLAPVSGLDALIKKSYELLGLITFFTTGPDETRAWTLKNGSRAPQAGGVIHSDFEKKFIKAEIINWQELIGAGGFARAREKGLIRLEGKEYIVRDGDVIEIMHGA